MLRRVAKRVSPLWEATFCMPALVQCSRWLHAEPCPARQARNPTTRATALLCNIEPEAQKAENGL